MSVDLYWLPLGAGAGGGGRCVRWNGRVYEAVLAGVQRRQRCALYHSALVVRLGEEHGEEHAEVHWAIEMGPVWANKEPDRGVVGEGAVGAAWLGRSALFRYEIRRWRAGHIPDLEYAVASPVRVSGDDDRAVRLLELVPECARLTWGRDPLRCGDMWNSNSLVSWVLARSGHDLAAVQPPPGGRAPGWKAGLVLAQRQAADVPPP